MNLGTFKGSIRVKMLGGILVLEILMAGHFDVGFVHPPAQANRSFALQQNGGRHRQHTNSPATQGRVMNENTALLHHFLNMPQAQRVNHVPAHSG
jgi:hypothetical protein